METATWLFIIGFSIVLVASENPIGTVELGGFPLAYYYSLILLLTAFHLRRRLKDEL